MDKDWLPDQLKTCRNLIDIALILTELRDKHHLLPTILEILFEQVQDIVDENCTVSNLKVAKCPQRPLR